MLRRWGPSPFIASAASARFEGIVAGGVSVTSTPVPDSSLRVDESPQPQNSEQKQQRTSNKRERKRQEAAAVEGGAPQKMRRIGNITVPWAVRRRWLRHIKHHSLFLQWVAFLARRHHRVTDPAAAHVAGVPATAGTVGCAKRSPFAVACERIVNEWGVPFMVDTSDCAKTVSSPSSCGPRDYPLSTAAEVGRFVEGPCHINPFVALDEAKGDEAPPSCTANTTTESAAAATKSAAIATEPAIAITSGDGILVDLLTGLPNARAVNVYGTRQLYGAPRDLPWMPSYMSSSCSSAVADRDGDGAARSGGGSGARNDCYGYVPTASLWYSESFCEGALTAAIAADKRAYAGEKGYGPQVPAGQPFAEVVRAYHVKRAADCGSNSAADTVISASSISPPADTMALFAEQQERAIAAFSVVLPSRPLRQELENFPQEHSLAETAFEVIAAWEGGGALPIAARARRATIANVMAGTADGTSQRAAAAAPTSAAASGGGDDGFRNSVSHSPLRWRPDVIIDVGGGNGCMPWAAGHRFGLGTTNVVNIERYVTANNIGFDGGMGPPDVRQHHPNGKLTAFGGSTVREVATMDAVAGGEGAGGSTIGTNERSTADNVPFMSGGVEEIPHTGCYVSQLGHGVMPPSDEIGGGGAEEAFGESEAVTCPCCSGNGGASDAAAAAGPLLRWCQYGPHRWSPQQLPYYRVVHKDIREVTWRADVRYRSDKAAVITKHLCGAGVDHLLRSFELQQYYPKYLFINSCCHMKSSYAEYINPQYLNDTMGIYCEEVYRCVTSRTSWLQQWGEAARTNAKVAALVRDLKWQHGAGKCIEGLMDEGRVRWLEERGYSAVMVEHVPSAVTPRNKLLIARRHDGLLTA